MGDDTIREIVLRGPFSAADFAEITALLRRIDARNPSGTYQIIAENRTVTLEEMERQMREVLPPDPGRVTVITTIRTAPD
jgi:hypothetical protein